MKQTKKITALALAVFLFASVAVGCANTTGTSSSSASMAPSSTAVSSEQPSSAPAEKTTIKLATLKGPTGLGMLKLMSDNDAKTAVNNYEFTLVGSPDEIVSKISTGEIDVAAVPTNLAATLYNKTNGKIQLAAINTLGVLSLLTDGENIKSVKDLKGKTIYASGQGSTPEYALNYILKQNGLEVGKDVKVQYVAEHAELATLMISGKVTTGVLPEPFVTQVMAKNKNVEIALDITKEWNKIAGDQSVLTMGCLIVRKDFAEKNKDAFRAFLDEYKASASYTTSNVEQAAALSEKYGIMAAAIAQKAIPNCNIVYIDGSEMKAKIPDFLNVLFKANPKSVGGNCQVMTFTIQNKNAPYPKIVGKILAAVFWITIWQLIYLSIKQEILIVSPVQVIQRLNELSRDSSFWFSALNSMLHVLAGFLLGLAAGVILAVLISSFQVMYDLFHPVISIIKATPVVSFIILALVWIKSSQVPAFTAFLEVTPIVLGNVTNGIAKTDSNLLQMAQSYRFGMARTVRRVYIPSIMPYFTAACTTGMGLAWKTSIAAEVLASTKLSIGGQIYDSKVYLETADLFAWTAVVIVMSVILERLMVAIMKRVGQKYNVNL